MIRDISIHIATVIVDKNNRENELNKNNRLINEYKYKINQEKVQSNFHIDYREQLYYIICRGGHCE